MGATSWLIVTGLALIAIGVLLRWWIGRYDLKDAAFESAWTLARGRRTAENPTAIEVVIKDINAQPTWTGKATRAAWTALGHYAAQVLGLVSLVMIAAGALVTAAAAVWRLYSG
jgi:hypothetical protein